MARFSLICLIAVFTTLNLRQDVQCQYTPSCPANVPGRDGRDGPPGHDGAPGRDGRDGRDGEKGERGMEGVQGEPGPQGQRGERGELGHPGRDAEPGPQGAKGDRGEAGHSGTDGLKGDHGSQGSKGGAGSCPSRNIKQFTWNEQNERTDEGLIKTFNFVKERSGSMLKVAFSSTARMRSSGRCARWYFAFNGSECTNPATIDGAIYQSTDDNDHRHFHVEGICGGIQRGTIAVSIRVGKCRGYSDTGDACTGFRTVSRIIVEEI